MPQCPQCNKPLVELTRQCPTCRADLELLVDYVNGLQSSLVRAEQLTRAGELGSAVWAYLEVLEVDPDNTAAKRQVGQVATAVRQFDRSAPGRRWSQGLPPANPEQRAPWPLWVKAALLTVAVVLAFGLGYMSGQQLPVDPSSAAAATDNLPPRKDNRLGN
jgi:hypothetical protein